MNKSIATVKEVEYLTPSAYLLRLEKNNISFQAGQYISLGLPGDAEKREYSVYSGENEAVLEVLIKEVEEGLVSKQLKSLMPGSRVEIDGPFGFFTISPHLRNNRKLLFIASGTGIAPFHSYIRTYENLDYKLLHGIRYLDEAYGREDYNPDRYIVCTSKDRGGTFHGRVTDYIRANPVNKDTLCYLCGNSEMIHDVYDILTGQGVPSENLHAEVYF